MADLNFYVLGTPPPVFREERKNGCPNLAKNNQSGGGGDMNETFSRRSVHTVDGSVILSVSSFTSRSKCDSLSV